MKTMFRRSLILAGLAVLAVAAIAYAHGGGYGYGYHMMGGGYGNGYHMMGQGYGPGSHMGGYGYGHMAGYYGPDLSQLTAEQREAYQDLAETHYEHMNGLRDQAIVLQNQLRTAADADAVAQVRDGLTDVANRMDEEMATFRAQVQDQFGIAQASYGPGYAGCPGRTGNW